MFKSPSWNSLQNLTPFQPQDVIAFNFIYLVSHQKQFNVNSMGSLLCDTAYVEKKKDRCADLSGGCLIRVRTESALSLCRPPQSEVCPSLWWPLSPFVVKSHSIWFMTVQFCQVCVCLLGSVSLTVY